MEIKETKAITDEAKRLNMFRKKLGLTQSAFAGKLGKNQATIQRYESGVYIIPADFVKDLNRVFKMSFNWFFTGKGDEIEGADEMGGGSVIMNIKTLKTNNEFISKEIESLKKEFMKLHREFHEFKHK